MKHQFTVNKLKQAHGRNWYRVEGFLDDKRVREFFPTKELAERAARKHNLERDREGHRLAAMPNKLRAEALACFERLVGTGKSLTQAVDYLLAHIDVRAKSITIEQAWKDYLLHEERRIKGSQIRAGSLATAKKVHRFVAEFGDEQLCDMSTKRIRTWLNELACEDGTPFATKSRDTYRLGLSGFFSHCVRSEWILVHPMKDQIEAYRESDDKQPGILVAEQAAKLLEAADAEILPAIAIGLFAGLRPTEVWRLAWEDVHWHKNEIDVKPGKSKTHRYRLVPMPANLVEWLAPYRGKNGKIFARSQAALVKRISAAGKAAGIEEWPKDGLRHSYGSHLLAQTGQKDLTATRMGHKDSDMLFRHYNNRRTKEEARAYFEIRPVNSDKVSELLAAA